MSKIPIIIGIVTIIFTSFASISVIFPSLFSFTFGKYSSNLNPLEFGVLGIPVIFSIFGMLTFGILYYKKKLPTSVITALDYVRCYEISKKHSMILLFAILSLYVGFSSPELFLDESKEWGDYNTLNDALELWPFGESENPYIEEQNDRYVRMFLLDTSLNLFQNIKFLPFIASILVILFTYLFTIQITQKRLSGIIAILIIIQSHTFLRFDTVAVYENFWVLFYLLSIYLIKKQWILSPIFYILSFFTKAFVAPYFVMTLFFAGRSSISKRTKLSLLGSYIAIIAIATVIIFTGDTIYPDVIQIDSSKFFLGLATFGPLLRYDFLLLFSILPVVVGLTVLARNKQHSDSILFLILGTLISGPILIVFTNFYEILPYRYIPLIIFFAIGVSMFFSKKPNS